MSFPTGAKDVDREILSKLPDEDVIKSCSVNSYLTKKVCDEGFFKRRLDKNYPELKFVINKQYEFSENAGLIYPSYKQAYLETVYYISKMKEIGYKYIKSGKIPKRQYREAKEIYDGVSDIKSTSAIHKRDKELGLLQYVVDTKNLNLIKYLMALYQFSPQTLSYDFYTTQLDIIKYFAENGGASLRMLRIGLENAYKQKDTEMIKYFESKLQ